MISLIILRLLAILSGGLLYWERGRGRTWKSTTVSRLVWAAPVGFALAWVAALPIHLALASGLCIALAFASIAFIGHSAHMGAYREIPAPKDGQWTELVTRWLPRLIDRDRHLTLYNAVGLAVIGMARFAVMLAAVIWYTPQLAWAIPLGGLMAVAYFAGWYVYGRTGRHDPLEWCEAFWGALQGLLLSLVFLL